MSTKKNVFILGLNELNRRKLKSIRNADQYEFHSLIPPEESEDAERYDIEGILTKIRKELDQFEESIDAVVSYIDFPMSGILPIIQKEYGVPGPSLESVLKCQHKYWSRIEQKKVVPETIPGFAPIDPFDDEALEKADLNFPFWLKPVKSVASNLGFRIKDKKDFKRAIGIIRKEIGRLSDPFNVVLDQADLPQEIKDIGGHFCVGEEIIGGRQCTLEGYMYQGNVEIYGVVDSIREKNRSTFRRYQYPSVLPGKIQQRMIETAKKFIKFVDLDNSAFNMEFFYDKKKDKIWLLETNTRISQSHIDLFEKVDGASHHQVMVELGLGNDPNFPHRQGDYKMAAKFFLRKFEDAFVTDTPSGIDLRMISQSIPGTIVAPIIDKNMWLHDLNEQDSYSFELAWVFSGGNDQRQLLKNFQFVKDHLRYGFSEKEQPQVVTFPTSGPLLAIPANKLKKVAK